MTQAPCALLPLCGEPQPHDPSSRMEVGIMQRQRQRALTWSLNVFIRKFHIVFLLISQWTELSNMAKHIHEGTWEMGLSFCRLYMSQSEVLLPWRRRSPPVSYHIRCTRHFALRDEAGWSVDHRSEELLTDSMLRKRGRSRTETEKQNQSRVKAEHGRRKEAGSEFKNYLEPTRSQTTGIKSLIAV